MSSLDPPPAIVPRHRERPRRRIALEPGKKPPAPKAGVLEPEADDRFEFGPGNTLPSAIPERIRRLASFCKGEARREVMRYMAPLFMQGASGPQIAQAFGISLPSVKRWRKEYRQLLRDELVTRAPIEHFAEATDRITVMRRFALGRLMDSSSTAGVGEDNQPLPETFNDRRLKVAWMGKLIELERLQLLLNTGYGVANVEVFAAAQQEGAKDETPATMLIEAVKGFVGEVHQLADMSLDDMESILADDDATGLDIDLDAERVGDE